MSMFGSVTDAQVFSRELTDKEMMDITGCRWVEPYTSHLTPHTSHLTDVSPRNFITGDILSWDTATWNLTTPWNSSEMEILDFEKDVCSNNEVKYK